MATLVGVQGIVDWKYDSSSTSSNLSETYNENSNQTLTSNTKEDVQNVTVIKHIINQEDLNAPKIKPYSTIAIEE